MSSLPHLLSNWRPPRVRLTDTTPVVLRLPNGDRQPGNLEIISLTGGLLSVPHTLNRGSRVSLIFLTRSGPVLGTAEMLSPVSWWQQPFRFVALEKDDQRRLRTMIQPVNPAEEAWIAKYRAALVDPRPKRAGISRMVVGSLTLLTLLGCAIYLLNIHLLK